MYTRVLGNRITQGGIPAGFAGHQFAGDALPFTGGINLIFWIVAAFTLIAAGTALWQLIPRAEL